MNPESDRSVAQLPMAAGANGSSVVDAVIAAISRDIASGALKPGQRIPTEPDLARTLGAGRNSLREAIKILVAMGVMEIKRADGTYVAKNFSPRMLDPVLYGILLGGGDMYALGELRRHLETGSFRQAAERGSTADETLGRTLAALEEAVERGDADACVEADMAFHRSVLGLAGNAMTERVCAMLDHMTMAGRRRAVEASLRRDGGVAMLARHRAMCRVIEQRDAAAALLVGDELFNALDAL